MRRILANVISIEEVVPETHLVWLESAPIAEQARPGQFVMVSCGEETMLRRPLSVHRVDGNKFSILFNIVGRGTHWLSQRKACDEVDILGPLGSGFIIEPNTKNILLVAGGIGLAPLVFLADTAVKQEVKATLLMGATSSVNLLDLLINGVLPFSIKVIKATDDGSEGFKGLVTSLIASQVEPADQVFACGPLAMYKTMSKITELKIKPVQVSLEVKMACGLGICYACTIKTSMGMRQVCRDGPVFDLKDILWGDVVC